MSVLYKLLREETSLEEARDQLSLKYLHVKHGKTGILDAVFEVYAAFNERQPTPFLEWVEKYYDPEAIKKAFKESGRGNLRIDELLGRE